MAVGGKWTHWGPIKELESAGPASSGARNLNVLEWKKELIASDCKVRRGGRKC